MGLRAWIVVFDVLTNEYMPTVTARLSPEVHFALIKAAREDARSLSSVIAIACTEWLQAQRRPIAAPAHRHPRPGRRPKRPDWCDPWLNRSLPPFLELRAEVTVEQIATEALKKPELATTWRKQIERALYHLEWSPWREPDGTEVWLRSV